MKLVLYISLVWILASCQRFSAETAPPPEIASLPQNQNETRPRPTPVISLSEVSNGTCLSLARLVDRLSDSMFDYPSAVMTTDFQILDESVTTNNAQFMAYSSFYYRMAPANSLVPFTKANQPDCKTVQLRMASGRLLTYNILESSDRHLKVQLSKDFGDDVPNYQRESLYKRYQPDEISIQLVSESEIKIVKKIKSFDPLCKKKKRVLNLYTSEVFSWAKAPEELPSSYAIEDRFLSLVLPSLKTPPEVDASMPINITTIKEMMMSSPRDDIKICSD